MIWTRIEYASSFTPIQNDDIRCQTISKCIYFGLKGTITKKKRDSELRITDPFRNFQIPKFSEKLTDIY